MLATSEMRVGIASSIVNLDEIVCCVDDLVRFSGWGGPEFVRAAWLDTSGRVQGCLGMTSECPTHAHVLRSALRDSIGLV